MENANKENQKMRNRKTWKMTLFTEIIYEQFSLSYLSSRCKAQNGSHVIDSITFRIHWIKFPLFFFSFNFPENSTRREINRSRQWDFSSGHKYANDFLFFFSLFALFYPSKHNERSLFNAKTGVCTSTRRLTLVVVVIILRLSIFFSRYARLVFHGVSFVLQRWRFTRRLC